NIFAQRCKAFPGRSGFLLGSGARDKGLFADEASFRSAGASLFNFGLKASDFALRFGDLLFDARKIFAGLLELMECTHARFLGFNMRGKLLFQFVFDAALVLLRT